jgi:hypothetical protein
LRQLQIELFNKAQERRLLPYDGDELVELEGDIGRAFLAIGGAILGALFLPGLGLAAGWFQGALLGAAIGYRLAGIFDGGDRSSAPDIKSRGAFAFGNTGELILLGSPVPVVYTNALNNSYINSDGVTEGGLYLEARTIYTRIAPTITISAEQGRKCRRCCRRMLIQPQSPFDMAFGAEVKLRHEPNTCFKAEIVLLSDPASDGTWCTSSES